MNKKRAAIIALVCLVAVLGFGYLCVQIPGFNGTDRSSSDNAIANERGDISAKSADGGTEELMAKFRNRKSAFSAPKPDKSTSTRLEISELEAFILKERDYSDENARFIQKYLDSVESSVRLTAIYSVCKYRTNLTTKLIEEILIKGCNGSLKKEIIEIASEFPSSYFLNLLNRVESNETDEGIKSLCRTSAAKISARIAASSIERKQE